MRHRGLAGDSNELGKRVGEPEQESGKSVVWAAKLSKDPWSDGAGYPELLLPGILGSGLRVQPLRPCPWSTGRQALHGLVTLSGQSLEKSGKPVLRHPQPAPGSLSSPTFAPDQLLQKILQGWKIYSGSLYYFSDVKKSWQEAENFCVSQGAHLASVTSKEEQVRAEDWVVLMGLLWDKGFWSFGLLPLREGMAETFMSPLSVREQIFIEFQ